MSGKIISTVRNNFLWGEYETLWYADRGTLFLWKLRIRTGSRDPLWALRWG